MGVDSLLEMYTILWAWSQYADLWKIFKESGLAFLPFFGIVFNSLISTLQSQDPGDASNASIKSVEISLVTALVIILIAVEPSIPLELGKVNYVKICAHDSVEPTKTFKQVYRIDKAQENINVYNRMEMTGFETVKIPPWWYAVLAFSNGVVRAGQEAIPCVADLRSDVNKIQSQKIISPAVKANLAQFIKHCFEPARKLFITHRETGIHTSNDELKKLIDKNYRVYRGQDIDWIGSSLFTQSNLYYPAITITKEQIPASIYSYPSTCKDIWYGSGAPSRNGLRDRLIIDFGRQVPGAYQRIKSVVRLILNHAQNEKDKQFAQQMINISASSVPHAALLANVFHEDDTNHEAIRFIDAYKNLNNEEKLDYEFYLLLKVNVNSNVVFNSPSDAIKSNSNAGDFLNHMAYSLGMPYQKIKHFSMIDTLIKTAPISGAIMILGVILFLPFGLVFSSYSLQFVIIASVGLFSLKFFYFLWHVAWWLDQNLVYLFFYESLAITGKKGDIIDIVASSMYIGLPILWGLIVTWAGYSINNFVSGGGGNETAAKPTYQQGEKGMDMGTRMAFNKSVDFAIDSMGSDKDKIEKDARNKKLDNLGKEKDALEAENSSLLSDMDQTKQDKEKFEQDLIQANDELQTLRAENEYIKQRLANESDYTADDDFYVPIPENETDSNGSKK